ncbi:phage terminase large subunit family protein [Aureliella helgolandensis]|uniref:Phage terminase large subunit (GpA) n=1 Tax=Aureliella helgolandensis TaxID=2527968 RepID=A0A518G2X6_9BACT|nr:terminase gpA endonuclease subunit [Aureliella helgolandensis]QDV22920.1 Phage terminase large subunit (GpA) [Aureliella helgolandensis]
MPPTAKRPRKQSRPKVIPKAPNSGAKQAKSGSQKAGLAKRQGGDTPRPHIHRLDDPIVSLRMELSRALRAGQARPPRSYREWLERCLIIPDGKYRGLRFRVDRQPVVGLWIDAIDSGQYTEFDFTAPSQFGKTLIAFVGPLLYHTCEIAENYVLGVPFADMAADKWDVDVKPVMQASPELRRLLPSSGSGSAGGKVRDRITLRNGVEIKLMAAGADDAGKAGFTARVLGVTEAARFSSSGTSSEEADPLRQLRARQRSYEDSERRTYVEGTVSVEEELPWALKRISTDSRICTPCPHCEYWITPERDDLLGWDGAQSENEAGDQAYWCCPVCGEKIEEEQRKSSVLEAQLVHRGQEIDTQGRITGEPPDTSRLFFRASAFHNLFLSAESIGKDEWRASQIPEDSPERFSADRELCQFVHCVPYVAPMYAEDLVLDKKAIGSRRVELPHLILPADTRWLTLGCDIGERKLWYLLLATRVDADGKIYRHIPAYGDIDVPSERMKLDRALIEALSEVHGLCQAGFVVDGTSDRRQPDQEWFDCNFETDTVLGFVRAISTELALPSAKKKYQPWVGAYGRGADKLTNARYTVPRKTGNEVCDIDPAGLWYANRIRRAKTIATIWDSSTTKWQVQQALTLRAFGVEPGGADVQTPGSVTLYSGTSKIHERFAQHVTNERLETKDTGFRGKKRAWVRHGANHLLDCFAMAWRATERAKHIASKQLYLPPFADQTTPAESNDLEKPGPSSAKTQKSWYDRE